MGGFFLREPVWNELLREDDRLLIQLDCPCKHLA